MRLSPTAARLSLLAPVIAGLLSSTAADAQQIVDETAARFPAPSPTNYTNQLTIGDLDGDDDLDIIFANGGNFSTPGVPQAQVVYINDGTGVFTDESVSRLNFFGLCRGVELGDIDDDGDLDVIFAQDFNRMPALFVNDGSGFFTDVSNAQLPNITLSSSRAQFGDIDNDGDLDLYITSGASNRFNCGQYRVYVNDGLGFFTDETASRHPLGNVCGNTDCLFGDIDNDFDLDVKTAGTGSNNGRLYRNNGAGVFSLVAGVPSDTNCYSYDFGDMDGDGDMDLLGANCGTGVTELLLKNDGTGAFTNVSSQISPNPSLDDNDSKFFDFDNDGDLDFIVARLGSGGERTYRNDGNGNFVQVSGVIEVISDSSLDIMVADLNSDGRLDIVTAQGESGSFVNRIYMNVTGPADTRAPLIINTEQLADTLDTSGPYVMRALILDGMTSDRNFFDNGIELNYTVNAGPVQQVAMRYSGGQVYRGEIPGQPGCSSIGYFVTARDFADNFALGHTLFFQIGLTTDVNGDGTVNVLDLIDLLLCFGLPAAPGCESEDINADGTVYVLDLIALLLDFGTSCP